MHKRKLVASLGAAAVAFGMAVPAHAIIDFTTGTWGATNPQTFSYAGAPISVKLEAFDAANNSVAFTENVPFDGDASQCSSLGLACTGDGIGISDDEVTFGNASTPEKEGKKQVERLMVTFTDPGTGNPAAVDIGSIIFLDLFGAPDDGLDLAEEVQMQFNGNGAGLAFAGTATDRTGFFVGSRGTAAEVGDPDTAYDNVTSIEFFADEKFFSSNVNSDFALAGIKLVPIPAALPLLGSALAALVLVARRGRNRTV